MRILAITIACVAAMSAAIADSSALAKSLGNIMPMGDSITWGYNVAGGYRDPLHSLLTDGGHSFTFVGSNTENSTSALNDANQERHEGYCGYIINGSGVGATRTGLDENLPAWIGPSGNAPDIILLLIGINDLASGYDVNNAPSRLDSLIGDIYSYRRDVSLFVASLTPCPSIEATVQSFNTSIRNIVTRQARDNDVHFVDMFGALTSSDLSSDGVHPNASGYNKMAHVWYDAMTVPEPNTTGLSTAGLLSVLCYAWWKWR